MIKAKRKAIGLTQEELAEKIGIEPRQMQYIENYEGDTSVSTLRKLIKVLDLNAQEVFEFINHKRTNKK